MRQAYFIALVQKRYFSRPYFLKFIAYYTQDLVYLIILLLCDGTASGGSGESSEEIDGIIGTERLPEFEDRISLPYLECILQETLRYESYDIIMFSFLQSDNTDIDGILPSLSVGLCHALTLLCQPIRS